MGWRVVKFLNHYSHQYAKLPLREKVICMLETIQKLISSMVWFFDGSFSRRVTSCFLVHKISDLTLYTLS